MWIFWMFNPLFSRLQWSPMLNELWTNPWISIHYPNFGRNFLPIQYDVPNFLSLCAKLNVVQIMGFLENEKNLSTLTSWRQDFEIDFVNIWIWWFVCLHNLYFYTFRYDNTIIIWIDEKTKICLLAWCFLVVVHY